jgi:hypothetical protein
VVVLTGEYMLGLGFAGIEAGVDATCCQPCVREDEPPSEGKYPEGCTAGGAGDIDCGLLAPGDNAAIVAYRMDPGPFEDPDPEEPDRKAASQLRS